MTVLSAVTLPGRIPARRACCAAQPDDAVLLQQFNQSGCHEAFEEIVRRHAGWIQALIQRKIKDKHLSEDVTQAVFVVLARKARTIRPGTVLSAWLFRVARFAARDAIKQEMRRTKRWQHVAQMRANEVEDVDGDSTNNRHGGRFADSASVPDVELDDAIACLNENDRQVILLRFYEDKTMAEIGVALGIAEVAAKQRASRALKRLRALLARRGVKVTSLAFLVGMLRMTRQTHAAVASTSHGIALAGIGRGEASGQSLRIAQSTLRSIAGAQCRIWAAMSSGVLAVVALGMLSPVMGRASIFPFFEQARSAVAVLVQDVVGSSGIALAPSSSRPVPLTKIWVGKANQGGWPVLPLDAPHTLLPLRSVSGSNAPVAVAQDAQGQLWYRKLESQPENESNTARVRNALNIDLDRELAALAANSQTMQGGWVDHPLDYFHAAAVAVAAQGGDWHMITTPAPVGPTTPIVIPFTQINNVTHDNSLNPGTVVPEPTTLSLLGGAALLLLRRRPRSICKDQTHRFCVYPASKLVTT